jgi:hypothetical protein
MGLKSSGGSYVRSGANPPPNPGFPYQTGVSPVSMTAPITQTYIYDFGAVGYNFPGTDPVSTSSYIQLWLVGNSGMNSVGTPGTAGPYTCYLDNIRVLKQLSTDPKWTTTGSGTWSTAANWANGVPNAVDARATLGNISAATSVTVSSNTTIGQLVIDAVATSAGTLAVANPYTIGGTGTLTFDVSSGRAGLYVFSQSGIGIATTSPTHDINVPIVANDSLLVDIGSRGALNLNGTVNFGAASTLSKSSAGTLNLNNKVSGGTLQLRGGATNFGATADVDNLTVMGGAKATILFTAAGNRVVRTKALSVTGKLDLTDNRLIVAYSGASPIASIRSLLQSGYASGSWNGVGINSSTAGSLSTSSTKGAIAYAEGTQVPGSLDLGGYALDGTDVVLAFTAAGDATLDGKVNTLDFNQLAGNFGGTDKTYAQGEFTYDGMVDSADFNVLAGNYGVAVPAAASLGTIVPEPASAAFALLGVLAIMPRRRPASVSIEPNT